jgi:hypothetical protein
MEPVFTEAHIELYSDPLHMFTTYFSWRLVLRSILMFFLIKVFKIMSWQFCLLLDLRLITYQTFIL